MKWPVILLATAFAMAVRAESPFAGLVYVSGESEAVRLENRAEGTLGRALVCGVEYIAAAGEARAVAWDSRSVADGWQANGTLARNDASIAIEGGRIASSVTWSRDATHLVRNWVVVATNATLAIESGAVVKFCENTGFKVEAGGRLVVAGTEDAPVVYTAAADDTIGGDSDLRDASPNDGDYSVDVVSGGTYSDLYCAVRYTTFPNLGTATIAAKAVAAATDGVVRIPVTISTDRTTRFSVDWRAGDAASGRLTWNSKNDGTKYIELPIAQGANAFDTFTVELYASQGINISTTARRCDVTIYANDRFPAVASAASEASVATRLENRDLASSYGAPVVCGTEWKSANGSARAEAWDTTKEQDGWLDLGGARVLVRNDSSITVEGGRLESNATWSPDATHLVRNWIVVPTNTTLAVAAGTVVKFCDGTGIKVEAGGRIVSAGTAERDVIFTSVNDDTAGGDTDLADEAPSTGDYEIAVVSGGVFSDSYTQLRYGASGAFGAASVPARVVAKKDDGVARIPVTISTSRTTPFAIDWAARDNGATAGEDYFLLSGRIEWTGAGQGTKYLEIPLERMAAGENESFTIELVTGLGINLNPSATLCEVFLYDTLPHDSAGEHTGHAASGWCDFAAMDSNAGTGPLFATDEVPVRYSTLWAGASSSAARVTVADAENNQTVLREAVAPDEGEILWRGGDYEDGRYDLAHKILDADGRIALVATATFIVNRDVVRHAGRLAADETWTADKVHLVVATVTVPNGVTLTIAPDAIVKFMPGASIVVENGGLGICKGAVLTHAYDDVMGGDTFFDGAETVPEDGGYSLSGDWEDDESTQYRYSMPLEVGGTLRGENRWPGHKTYIVTGNLTLVSGATLTIEAGAVVKFNEGRSFTVNSGATLNAQGTRSSPVVFTSIKDDAHGGDTNGDGKNTVAYSGDWRQIRIAGGVFNAKYVKMLYSSNDNNQGGLYVTGGNVTMDGCHIAHCKYDAMRSTGGKSVVRNSIFEDASIGVAPNGGPAEYYNCVFIGLTTAVRWPSGTFVNCVFTDVSSVFFDSANVSAIRNCVMWNPVGIGPQSLSNAGSNGNIWGDPRFENAEKGDFRIKADSPCVDAGDGTVAPEKDYYNQPRQTIQGVEPTGTPGANSAYADIGIYEVQPRNAGADVDLEVKAVMVPETMTVGEFVTISWREANIGSVDTDDKWYDKVELVSANGAVVTLGTVPVTGILAGGEKTITESSFRVPAAAEGAARVRVTANYNRDIYEGSLTANNVALSEWKTVLLPTFEDEDFKRMTLVSGGSAALRIPARSGISAIRIRGGHDIAVFAGVGYVPVASRYDVAAVALSDGSYLLVLPMSVDETDFYMTLQNGSTSSESIQLETLTDTISVFDISPSEMSNIGIGYLTVHGIGMDRVTGVKLEGTSTRSAYEVTPVSSGKLTAMVDMANAVEGNYIVVLETEDATTIRTAATISVYKPKSGPKLEARLEIPEAVRQNRIYTGKIIYSNVGDTEMFAPYLKMTAIDASVRLANEDDWQTAPLYVLGIAHSYPAGILYPGETEQIEFEFRAGAAPRFKLEEVADYSETWAIKEKALSKAATILNRRGRRVVSWCNINRYAEILEHGTNTQAICGTLVSSSDGTPVANARIVAFVEDGKVLSADTVDVNGCFIVGDIQGATNVVMFAQIGETFVASRKIEVPEHEDIIGLSWAINAGHKLVFSFEGVNEEDWATGVRVKIDRIGSSTTQSKVFYAPDEAVMTVWDTGKYAISISTRNGYNISQIIEVQPGLHMSNVLVDFTAGATMSGTVKDKSGHVVTNATVSLTSLANIGDVRYSSSDDHGVFKFGCLDAGEYSLAAEAREHGMSDTVVVTVYKDRVITGMDIILERYENLLHVYVTGLESGRAIFQTQAGNISEDVAIPANGHFVLKGLPEGVGNVRLFNSDGELVGVVSDVLIKSGINARSVTVDTNKVMLVGSAYDGNGVPIRAKWSLVTPYSDGVFIDSDDDGLVAQELRKANYWGTVSAPGFLDKNFYVKLDAHKEVSVVLERGGYLAHTLSSDVDVNSASVTFKAKGISVSGNRIGVRDLVSECLPTSEEALGFVVHSSGAYYTDVISVEAGATGEVSRVTSGRNLRIHFGTNSDISILKLEHQDGSGFWSTFPVSGGELSLSEYPAVELKLIAYSSKGNIVAEKYISAEHRDVDMETVQTVTISGSIPGARKGLCEGGVIVFCSAIGEHLATAFLAANGSFFANEIPDNFEVVWIELQGGIVFSVARADAQSAGWHIPIPTNLGIASFEYTDTEGNPLVGLPVTITISGGYSTAQKTDSHGRIFVTTQKGETVTGNTAGNETQPTTVVDPPRCGRCGQYPCTCNNLEPEQPTPIPIHVCAKCGQDPCVCNVSNHIDIQSNDNEVETEDIAIEVLPPLKGTRSEVVHYADWQLREGRWLMPRMNRLHELMDDMNAVAIDSIPSCNDPKCTYCKEKFGDYNKRIYLRFVKLRGIVKDYAYTCEAELNQIRFISQIRHRQMVMGVGALAGGLVAGTVSSSAAVSAGLVAEGSAGATMIGFGASAATSAVYTGLDLYAESAAGTAQDIYSIGDSLLRDYVDNAAVGIDDALYAGGYGSTRFQIAPAISAGVERSLGAAGTTISVGIWAAGFIPKTLDFYREMNGYLQTFDGHLATLSSLISVSRSAAEAKYKKCVSGDCASSWSSETGDGCQCKGSEPIFVPGNQGVIAAEVPQSCDPNEMTGPAGVGEQRYVKPGEWMDYTIYFENATNATAAAQDVYVTLPKDAGLDWSTFELGEVVFGDNIDTGLSGAFDGVSSYALPGTNWSVRTEVTHSGDNVVWHLRIVDPTTADNYPADAYAGFLPPDDETGRGEGHLRYRVRVKDDAAARNVIRATAIIEFDPLNGNPPIETNPSWWNTVAQVKSVVFEGAGGARELIVGAEYGQLPEAPQRKGYAFAGWFTGPGGTGRKITSASIVGANDGKLYPHYLANAYEVAFRPSGASGTMDNQVFTFDIPAALASCAFTMDGHDFAGWATNAVSQAVFADCAVVTNLASESGAVVELFATWRLREEPPPSRTWTVSFDAAGGECAEINRPIADGEAIGSLPVPTKDGFEFLGWFADGAAVARDFIVRGDATLVAKWGAYALYPDGGSGEIPFGAASVWDGMLLDGNIPCGSVQVKFAKAKANKKTGEISAKIKATILLAGEKKQTVGGNASFDEDGGASFTGEDKSGRVLEIKFAGRSMSGSFDGLRLDGARNLFVSKDALDKSDAAEFDKKWNGALNMVWQGGSVAVAFGKKGKVKVSGTASGGAKISAAAQVTIGEKRSVVPVINSKGASMAFLIWLPNAGGRAEIAGLDGVKIGRAGEIRDGLVFSTGAVDDTVELFLKNGKPTAPKADKVKAVDGEIATLVDNGNPIALKFTYTPKTGAFKGSFTLFEIVGGKLKKQAANFTGVFVDGIGYGRAVMKKLGISWPVEVK